MARSRNGIRLAYELYRQGDAPARLVLVHSLAMDRTFWLPVARRLSDAAEVLIYDCRGHGQSDKPSGPYTVEGFADDLADLLDAVGWKSAVVAGASMGGCVALGFAQRYPARTEGLGLIDTTAYYGPDAPATWEDRAKKALDGGMEALVEFQKTRWFGDRLREDHPDVVDQTIKVFLANDVNAYAEACRMLGSCDLRAGLPALDMPVRILVGEEDYATPVAMAESMHDSIPRSELRVIPGARHFTPLEAPDMVASDLAKLLNAGRPD